VMSTSVICSAVLHITASAAVLPVRTVLTTTVLGCVFILHAAVARAGLTLHATKMKHAARFATASSAEDAESLSRAIDAGGSSAKVAATK
jgi:hypothetical protein